MAGLLNPAVHALSAPVFDGAGNIAAVLSMFGPIGAFDSNWAGPIAKALAGAAQTLSRALGHD